MRKIHLFAQNQDKFKSWDNFQNYDKAFKQFVLGVLCFVSVSYVLGPFLYYPLVYPFYFLSLVGGLIHIIAIIVIYTIPAEYIKKLVKPYLIVLVVLLFPITVFGLSVGIITQFFWNFAIPICIYVVYPDKTTVKWTFYCLCLMLLTFVLSLVLRHYYISVLYHDFLYNLHAESFTRASVRNIINAFSAFLLVCYCLYYVHRFHQMQVRRLMDLIDANNKKNENLLIIENGEKEEKYGKIYIQIVEYLETNQPYLRADFTLSQMAHDMNINVTYLSKAIRIQKNMNFNSLINSYRINKVKEMIQQASSRKYTLKYIYLFSGFKSQSSFNKAFKIQEGFTPSEYYRQQVNNG